MIFILANYINSQNSNNQLFSDSSNPIKIQQLAQKQRFYNSYGNQSTCPRKPSGFDLPITSVNGIAVVLTTSEAPGGFLQKSIPLVNILQNWLFQKKYFNNNSKSQKSAWLSFSPLPILSAALAGVAMQSSPSESTDNTLAHIRKI